MQNDNNNINIIPVEGKVCIGRPRNLLNFILYRSKSSILFFSDWEYSLMDKMRSFKLHVFSSSLNALDSYF